jgi:hypothetical protein
MTSIDEGFEGDGRAIDIKNLGQSMWDALGPIVNYDKRRHVDFGVDERV